MGVQVLTDSTSYLSEEIRKELNIRLVSLSLSFAGENSVKEIDFDNNSFYELMAMKGIPTSSQPAVGEIYQEMKEVIESGDSLCGVFISSNMSGTYQTALLAQKMILKDYPGANIEIIDSRSNCMQLGFTAICAARAAKAGQGLEQVKAVALENIKRSRFLFIPDNLEYLKKGGRIGGAGALIGNLLKIIPILTVADGETSVLTKVRTKKNAVQTMIDKMMSDFAVYGLGEIGVHHINCFQEAAQLKSLIEAKLSVSIDIIDIGPVIGLHVGPGAIGIVYYTEKDMN